MTHALRLAAIKLHRAVLLWFPYRQGREAVTNITPLAAPALSATKLSRHANRLGLQHSIVPGLVLGGAAGLDAVLGKSQ